MMVLKGVFFACVVIPPCTTLPLTAPVDPYNELSSFETKLKIVMEVKIPESERMWAAAKIEDRYKAKFLESAKKDNKIAEQGNEIKSLAIEKGKEEQKNNQRGVELKHFACGANLRYYMEILPMAYGLKKGEKIEKSEALRGTIRRARDTIKRRTWTINLSVYHLRKLCLEYQDDENEHDRKSVGWINRVWVSYRKMKKATISFDSKADENSLLSLLLDFQEATNENTSVNIFEDQCKQCFWSHQTVDEFDPTPEIKNISMMISGDEKKRIIAEYGKEKNNPKLSPKEAEYVKDLIDSGFYFTNPDNLAERYEACFEIFYFARDKDIADLKAELEEMWPKIGYPNQVHTLCLAYTDLYNIISQTDVHANKRATDDMCQPNTTDFRKYVNQITPSKRVPKENYLKVVKFMDLLD